MSKVVQKDCTWYQYIIIVYNMLDISRIIGCFYLGTLIPRVPPIVAGGGHPPLTSKIV